MKHEVGVISMSVVSAIFLYTIKEGEMTALGSIYSIFVPLGVVLDGKHCAYSGVVVCIIFHQDGSEHTVNCFTQIWIA